MEVETGKCQEKIDLIYLKEEKINSALKLEEKVLPRNLNGKKWYILLGAYTELLVLYSCD